MLLIRKENSRLPGYIVLAVTLFVFGIGSANANPYHHKLLSAAGDTTVPNYRDSLHYPIYDRRGDFLSNYRRSTYDLRNPSNLRDSVVYDPKTRRILFGYGIMQPRAALNLSGSRRSLFIQIFAQDAGVAWASLDLTRAGLHLLNAGIEALKERPARRMRRED